MNPLNVANALYYHFKEKNFQRSALSKKDETMFQYLVGILESDAEIIHTQTLDINEYEPVFETVLVSDEYESLTEHTSRASLSTKQGPGLQIPEKHKEWPLEDEYKAPTEYTSWSPKQESTPEDLQRPEKYKEESLEDNESPTEEYTSRSPKQESTEWSLEDEYESPTEEYTSWSPKQESTPEGLHRPKKHKEWALEDESPKEEYTSWSPKQESTEWSLEDEYESPTEEYTSWSPKQESTSEGLQRPEKHREEWSLEEKRKVINTWLSAKIQKPKQTFPHLSWSSMKNRYPRLQHESQLYRFKKHIAKADSIGKLSSNNSKR